MLNLNQIAVLFLNSTINGEGSVDESKHCLSKATSFDFFINDAKSLELSADANCVTVYQNFFTNEVTQIDINISSESLDKDFEFQFTKEDADFEVLVDKLSDKLYTKLNSVDIFVKSEQSKDFIKDADTDEELEFTISLPRLVRTKESTDCYSFDVVHADTTITITKEEFEAHKLEDNAYLEEVLREIVFTDEKINKHEMYCSNTTIFDLDLDVVALLKDAFNKAI